MNRSKQASMAIKTIVVLLIGLTLAFVQLAEAQQVKKIPRLAILSARSPGSLASFDALQQGLRNLGYIEGQASSLTIAMHEASLSCFLTLR
jgi:hypothetical protein